MFVMVFGLKLMEFVCSVVEKMKFRFLLCWGLMLFGVVLVIRVY